MSYDVGRKKASGPRRSLLWAVGLAAWDALLGGTFYTCLLVGPIWFLVVLVKCAIRPPGLRLFVLQLAIPAALFGIGFGLNAAQISAAEARAQRVAAACLAYRNAEGTFPGRLDDLVPRYLPSLPSARFVPGPWSRFGYFLQDGGPRLYWYVVPPYDRIILEIDTGRRRSMR